jgi:hypothetical protein
MVTFVKEFEQYILNECRSESILSVIPGSEADVYLEILKKMHEMEKTGKCPDEVYILINVDFFRVR